MNSDINKKSNSKNDTQGIIESGDIFSFTVQKLVQKKLKILKMFNDSIWLRAMMSRKIKIKIIDFLC